MNRLVAIRGALLLATLLPVQDLDRYAMLRRQGSHQGVTQIEKDESGKSLAPSSSVYSVYSLSGRAFFPRDC
jgi:hypothetical protein